LNATHPLIHSALLKTKRKVYKADSFIDNGQGKLILIPKGKLPGEKIRSPLQ